MSTTVDVETGMASIAALVIPSVTVRDESGVADSMLMTAATLAPRPEKFITGVKITAVEQTKQNLNLIYTLNYRYYHCSMAGGLGGLTASWPGLLKNVARILAALSSHTTLPGSVDNSQPVVETMGPVYDPAGNQFLGAEISISFLQFLEA